MWQQFLKENQRPDFAFVSVAIDTQGAAAVEPFAVPTRDAFLTLIDADNLLGRTFGFKAIPNGIFVEADGRIDAVTASGFEARKPATLEHVRNWLAAKPAGFDELKDLQLSEKALRLFGDASAALRGDQRESAVALLRRAAALDPDNFIIRKQFWAVEHPERFYNGEIDTAWQREQLSLGL